MAKCHLWQEDFVQANRSLDSAENGLKETLSSHRFCAAIVKRLRAQVLMGEAKSTIRLCNGRETASTRNQNETSGLSKKTNRFDKDMKQSFNQAGSLLDQAALNLMDARKTLRSVRRSIGQWKELYLTNVQLEVEHLLLILFSNEFDIDPEDSQLEFVARIHNHLGRGLEAIRGGWDCLPTPVISPSQSRSTSEAPTDRKQFVDQWFMLMVTGYVALLTYSQFKRAAYKTSGKNSGRTALQKAIITNSGASDLQFELEDLQSYFQRWRALNESAGLERFVNLDSSKKPNSPGKPPAVWGNILATTKEKILATEDRRLKRDICIDFMRENLENVNTFIREYNDIHLRPNNHEMIDKLHKDALATVKGLPKNNKKIRRKK